VEAYYFKILWIGHIKLHYQLLPIRAIFCAITLFNFTLHAQQNPQFSQYLQNPFVLNPAMTGTEDYVDVNVGYRNQWTGFDGGPKTATLSINSAIYPSKAPYLPYDGSSHQGIGAFVYSDDFGPIQQNGFYGSYAYHLKVSEDWFLSIGTFVGATQFKFDDSDIVVFDNPNDPLIRNVSNLNFNMSIGFYAYSKYLFLGVAANQIINNHTGFSDTNTGGALLPNYNMLLGSRISINEKMLFVPFTLVKAVENAPIQWDAGAKFIYDNKFWGGMAYRNEEAIIGFFGLNLLENVLLSYSYDWITAQFSGIQAGTHEIIIGYRFNLAKLNCACPKYSL
jgi:type IX secretion system PorP/SprF family membrane protein